MEGNNDMSSAPASETQPAGEIVEELEAPGAMAIFGNSECTRRTLFLQRLMY